MKAVVITGIGGVEKLEYTSIGTPASGKDEVLLKVLYCGVNHLDFLIREGRRPGIPGFPHILGSEIVGEYKGNIYAVYPWTFCGKCKQCKSGNEQICDTGGTLGRTLWGGYAEFVAVPKKNLLPVMPNSFRHLKQNGILNQVEDAQQGIQNDKNAVVCSIVLTGTTACHLVRRANIPNKATVLVTGATGGVGTLVLQLLKHKKCTVICVTSHENKTPLLKKLGADHVVSVNKMVGEVKYAIDLVGGETWSKAIQVLGKNGTLVFCSTSKEEMGKVDIGNAFARQLNILGSYGGNRNDLMEALLLLEKGIFKPVVDSVYPLKEAAKAHQKMEQQKLFGKIILAV